MLGSWEKILQGFILQAAFSDFISLIQNVFHGPRLKSREKLSNFSQL